MFKPPPPKPSPRIPGEKREFKNLVPPQRLAPDGTISSSRKHEVAFGNDPLMDEINRLRGENRRLLELEELQREEILELRKQLQQLARRFK
jgi:hypothetical protein